MHCKTPLAHDPTVLAFVHASTRHCTSPCWTLAFSIALLTNIIRGKPAHSTSLCAGLYVALRQPLLDYSTSIGLRILTARIHEIDFPRIVRTVTVPLVGTATITIDKMRCTKFELSEKDAQLAFAGDAFALAAKDASASFDFEWAWRAVGLSGGGGACC